MRLRRSLPLIDPAARGLSERAVVIGLLALAAVVMLVVSATDLRHLLGGGGPPDPTG